MKPVKLSLRLATIAEMVMPGSVIADIGTDHALLPAFLVKTGIVEKAYACDVAKGPLNRAIHLIEQYDLQAMITPILCSGLEKVPMDTTTIVIAGMGYETIKMILEADFDRIRSFKRLILQSNTELEALRAWITKHHFAIVSERIIKDGHFYTILEVDPNQSQTLNDDQILFGLANEEQPAFLPFWEFRYQTLSAILQKMPSTHAQYAEYRETLQRIKMRLKK